MSRSPPTACIPIISQSRSHENGIIRDTDWRLIRLLLGCRGKFSHCGHLSNRNMTSSRSFKKFDQPTLSLIVKACSTKSDVYNCVVMNNNLLTANQAWSRCIVLAPGALHFPKHCTLEPVGAALHIFTLFVCDGFSLVACPSTRPLIGWAWSLSRVRPLTAADLLLPLNAWSVTLW